jgi:hypothetical protein
VQVEDENTWKITSSNISKNWTRCFDLDSFMALYLENIIIYNKTWDKNGVG